MKIFDFEIYVGLINNLLLGEVLLEFLKSGLLHMYGSSSLVLVDYL